MSKLTRKAVEKMTIEGQVYDEFTCKKDGTVVFKRSYFYRDGRTAAKFGQELVEKMPGLVLVGTEDRPADWPKVSYFYATFRAAA